MNYLFHILIEITVLICLPEQSELDGFPHVQYDQTELTYTSVKSEILRIKSNPLIQLLSEHSLSTLVTGLLVDKLIPHWLTTPWSFEGHTPVPREGKIACGYFRLHHPPTHGL